MTTVRTATRARLLEAAREVVDESGYGGASVAAVARRAGLATGTLYRHWPSKAELFAELFRAVCDGELEVMGAAGDAMASDSAARAVEAIIVAFAERALRNRRLAWALLAEPVDPLVDAERIAYRRRYAGCLETYLRAAITADEIPDQDVELTAAALVGGVAEALVGPLSPLAAERRPPPEVVEALRRFVTRAVGAAPA